MREQLEWKSQVKLFASEFSMNVLGETSRTSHKIWKTDVQEQTIFKEFQKELRYTTVKLQQGVWSRRAARRSWGCWGCDSASPRQLCDEPDTNQSYVVSSTGSASLETDVTKGIKITTKQNKTYTAWQLRGEWEKYERNNSEDTEVCEGGKGGASGIREHSPVANGEDHANAGCPQQPLEDHDRAATNTTAHRGLHTTAGGGCVLKEGAAHGEPMLEHAAGRNCGPWDTHAGAVCSQRTALWGKDPCWSSSWRTATPKSSLFCPW